MPICFILSKSSNKLLSVDIILNTKAMANSIIFGLSLINLLKSIVNLREVRVVKGTFYGFSHFVLHSTNYNFLCWLVGPLLLRALDRAFSCIFRSIRELLVFFVAYGIYLLWKDSLLLFDRA